MKRKILKLGRVREMRSGLFGRMGGGGLRLGNFGRVRGGGLRLENRTGSGVMWGLKGGIFHRNLGSFPGFGKKLMAGGGVHPYKVGWRLASLILVFLGAFGVTFVVSRNKAPVERTEAAMNGSYTASVTVTGTGSGGGGAGDINLNVDATPEGTLVVAKQTLQMTTNAPNGAEVYVSGGAETGMVLAGGGSGSDKLNRHTASVGNPAVLNVNTWGYAVPSDITGNGVSMAGFGETSVYQEAADNTNAGSVIGGGAGSLKFAGVRVADSVSPVTMEKIYSGTTKIFPVYLGMLVGSNLAQGNYETNIYIIQ